MFISIFWNKELILIVYNKIFIVNRIRDNLVITLIPLFVVYTISIMNREQLIKNGVLYKNCDNIKLFMLYSSVIPRHVSSNDISISKSKSNIDWI